MIGCGKRSWRKSDGEDISDGVGGDFWDWVCDVCTLYVLGGDH